MTGTLKAGPSVTSNLYSKKSFLPYKFNFQTETYHPQANADTHGYEGPLHVSYGCSTYKIADEYIDTAKSYAGIDQSIDVNDFGTVNMTCRWPKWINPQTGRRSDAAHGFVHPVMESQQNLHLLLESKAVRIIFEGTKAIGVEYMAKQVLRQTL